jgi:RNA polymerase primary sigma factor
MNNTQRTFAPPGPSWEFARGNETANLCSLYQREISRVQLLRPQQELKLATRIKRGDKKAREQLIRANLGLVIGIAHEYEGFGLPLLDLISEGNIGLLKAVRRFDPAKGVRLSTQAASWIKQAIKRALAAGPRPLGQGQQQP